METPRELYGKGRDGLERGMYNRHNNFGYIESLKKVYEGRINLYEGGLKPDEPHSLQSSLEFLIQT